jgi:hypothetical protein
MLGYLSLCGALLENALKHIHFLETFAAMV